MEWFEVEDVDKIESPKLLVYPQRVINNIRSMIQVAGDPQRLYPHIKTHKTKEVVEICKRFGIDKFKCATLGEADLLGHCDVKEVVFSMPLQMQMMDRFRQIESNYPQTEFSALVDNLELLNQLTDYSEKSDQPLNLWLDVNVGMNRTGIEPDENAIKLFRTMCKAENVRPKGLHIYDGHIHQSDLNERTKACNEAFERADALISSINSAGLTIDTIIAGGTPTFQIHAQRSEVHLSPGTSVFWDAGYSELFEEMPFEHAAVLMTRIISKPGKQLLCFDLGHKMVASEMPLPRVHFLIDNNLKQISQSEEHLVVQYDGPDNFEIGQVFYAIPRHICPTVSKYPYLTTIENNKTKDQWLVTARDH